MNYFYDGVVSWEEYLLRSRQELEFLLDSKYKSDEKVFQNFFERNPHFLPGSLIPNRFIIEPEDNYAPFPGALISQPPLRSYQEYIPDFLWIAHDKYTVYPVFIEIEAPSKNWFNKDGTLSSKFTQAYHQLMSWKTWFNDADNQQVFWKTLQVPYFLSEKGSVEPKFILIYGRGKEISSTDKNCIRKNMENNEFRLLTYDDLRPSDKTKHLTTAKLVSGKYMFYNNWKVSPVEFLLGDKQLLGGDSGFVELMTPLIERYRGENVRLLPEMDWEKMTLACNRLSISVGGKHNTLRRNF